MTQTVPSATIEDALYAWVAAASGVPVIWEHQNAPRPAAPYVSLLLATVEPTGRDWDGSEANPLVFADKAVTFDNTTDQVLATLHGLQTGDGPLRLEVTGGALPAELAEDTDYYWIRDSADDGGLAANLYDANAGTRVTFSDDGTGSAVLVDTPETVRVGAEVTNYARGLRRCRLVMTCFAASATGVTSAIGLLESVAAKARLPARRAALRTAGVGVPVFGAAQSAGGALNPAYFEPRAVLECTFFAASEVSETVGRVDFVRVTAQNKDTGGTPLAEVQVFVPEDPADA